jgi:hypothetical protein
MASFLSRLLGRGRREAVEREAVEEGMSPAERRLADERIEARRADAGAEEYGMAGLPQIDPDDAFREPRV